MWNDFSSAIQYFFSASPIVEEVLLQLQINFATSHFYEKNKFILDRLFSLSTNIVAMQQQATAKYQVAASAPPPSYNQACDEVKEPVQTDRYGLVYGVKGWNQVASENLAAVLERLEVQDFYSKHINSLQGDKIVFVFDDSGSMNNISDDQDLEAHDGPGQMTRWDELKKFAQDAIAVYGGLSSVGVDCYFLNRPATLGVRAFEQLDNSFQVAPTPENLTPLSERVQSVIDANKDVDGRLIINIVTDGTPQSLGGLDSMVRFTKVLSEKPDNVIVNIRLCTDNEKVVGEYNRLDKSIKLLDVNDDYQKEKQEAETFTGKKMTRGDYLLKCTIGAADISLPKENRFDYWDEQPVKKAGNNNAYEAKVSAGGCCGECIIL